ncbi:DUF6191 domain-containing protein [Isoptericola variabilis]|uniref:Uncharacterized protein n=1 Tax=Isoptericola variabilis (strain 225) TaxID=743718 RepID=F6FSZ9_ISOV2|nr:DUF6191 domain-containing protein [Isoptericola variabilis]AEG43140.1 hypothetical protein Isova_0341 [Isoptericola variabilis 225]TWH35071.1 hypothetical protein L600_000100000750 [Isoptericola variabilis J7]
MAGWVTAVVVALLVIFQPGRAHVTEEQERRRLDIVRTPAEGAPFGVDLDACIAYLPGEEERPDGKD